MRLLFVLLGLFTPHYCTVSGLNVQDAHKTDAQFRSEVEAAATIHAKSGAGHAALDGQGRARSRTILDALMDTSVPGALSVEDADEFRAMLHRHERRHEKHGLSRLEREQRQSTLIKRSLIERTVQATHSQLTPGHGQVGIEAELQHYPRIVVALTDPAARTGAAARQGANAAVVAPAAATLAPLCYSNPYLRARNRAWYIATDAEDNDPDAASVTYWKGPYAKHLNSDDDDDGKAQLEWGTCGLNVAMEMITEPIDTDSDFTNFRGPSVVANNVDGSTTFTAGAAIVGVPGINDVPENNLAYIIMTWRIFLYTMTRYMDGALATAYEVGAVGAVVGVPRGPPYAAAVQADFQRALATKWDGVTATNNIVVPMSVVLDDFAAQLVTAANAAGVVANQWPGLAEYQLTVDEFPSYIRYNTQVGPVGLRAPARVGFHASRGSKYGGLYTYYMYFQRKTAAQISQTFNLFGVSPQINYAVPLRNFGDRSLVLVPASTHAIAVAAAGGVAPPAPMLGAEVFPTVHKPHVGPAPPNPRAFVSRMWSHLQTEVEATLTQPAVAAYVVARVTALQATANAIGTPAHAALLVLSNGYAQLTTDMEADIRGFFNVFMHYYMMHGFLGYLSKHEWPVLIKTPVNDLLRALDATSRQVIALWWDSVSNQGTVATARAVLDGACQTIWDNAHIGPAPIVVVGAPYLGFPLTVGTNQQKNDIITNVFVAVGDGSAGVNIRWSGERAAVSQIQMGAWVIRAFRNTEYGSFTRNARNYAQPAVPAFPANRKAETKADHPLLPPALYNRVSVLLESRHSGNFMWHYNWVGLWPQLSAMFLHVGPGGPGQPLAAARTYHSLPAALTRAQMNAELAARREEMHNLQFSTLIEQLEQLEHTQEQQQQREQAQLVSHNQHKHRHKHSTHSSLLQLRDHVRSAARGEIEVPPAAVHAHTSSEGGVGTKVGLMKGESFASEAAIADVSKPPAVVALDKSKSLTPEEINKNVQNRWTKYYKNDHDLITVIWDKAQKHIDEQTKNKKPILERTTSEKGKGR